METAALLPDELFSLASEIPSPHRVHGNSMDDFRPTEPKAIVRYMLLFRCISHWIGSLGRP